MLLIVDLFHDSNDKQSCLGENTALAPSRVEGSQLIDGVVVESGEKGMEGRKKRIFKNSRVSSDKLGVALVSV